MKESDKSSYRDKVYSVISQQKLYLEPELSLIDLSNKTSITPCHLSQIINETFRSGFRDFINSFRIEES